ncbi:hypothetical protein [Streptomyces sp. NPDC017448]|uniref:hypothetical protein n=1 Tax=Streptomyces sp. NPDC017448 TaxID=3364996 RepID=UPI00379EBD8A
MEEEEDPSAEFLAAALMVFRPQRADRIIDEAITALQVTRSLVGLVALGWITIAYWGAADNPVAAKYEDLTLAAMMLVFTVPVVLAAFVLASGRSSRSLYLSRTRGPLRAVGALVGTYYLIVLVLPAIGRATGENFDFTKLLILLLLIPVYAAAWLYLILGAALAVTTAFRLADVHETLPPLVSPFPVWALLVIQLADPPMAAIPLPLRVLFLVGPPVSVTALSYAELRRLRLYHGITLRAALNRT